MIGCIGGLFLCVMGLLAWHMAHPFTYCHINSQHPGHQYCFSSILYVLSILGCATVGESWFSLIRSCHNLLRPQAPSYLLWTHITYRQLRYGNTPDFALKAPLCLLLITFRFPYCFKRAFSPYMVQEMLMADGSASEVLRTHV
jgi:hypothetical protein